MGSGNLVFFLGLGEPRAYLDPKEPTTLGLLLMISPNLKEATGGEFRVYNIGLP